MTHLLVTNDFPPKVGGIQSYLWELWRRLPAGSAVVMTTPYEGDSAWDRAQGFRVVRDRDKVLLPHPGLLRRIRALADEVDASLVLLDPALPLGALGPRLGRPYGVVLHGAEVTVPGRLPGSAALLGRVLRGAELVVSAGTYAAAEAERTAGGPLPVVQVPPGVDAERFRPLAPAARFDARARLGIGADATVVLGLSRLVPRKGFDVLVRAAATLAPVHPGLEVLLAGSGRDRARLERLATRTGAPVRFLGRVPDDDLPALYGAADVFAMLCRSRWAGLEQEGFGIVFLEAAACGVAQLAGASGGADEAVVHGRTGLVVRDPSSVVSAAAALGRLLDDDALRARLGRASRARVEDGFTYDLLAARLATAIQAGVPRPRPVGLGA